MSVEHPRGYTVDRRQFVKTATTLAAVGLLPRKAYPKGETPPNILFITVDEMSYPTIFPSGISDAGQFLAQFMPNTYNLLWQKGVKFANHHSASSACSPSRGAFTNGLYSQQNWVTQTIKDFPGTKGAFQPQLSPVFPTYGSLLKQAGYQTPYIGKWHISIPVPPSEGGNGLRPYGFDYMTFPDPTGSNLQGTFGDEPNDYHSDQYIESQATAWLSARVPGEGPWCLTVAFVNPHDVQTFPAGTEYDDFAAVFASPTANPQQLPQIATYATDECAVAVPYSKNVLRDPPPLGYPPVPPNWESADQIKANKPSTQYFARLFQQMVFGGASDDPSVTTFNIIPYLSGSPVNGVAIAPYSYWARSRDSYTQIMSILDGHIGAVVGALPPAVAQNTIIVFLSDHGDYAGAHGLLTGKICTCYEEAWKVPLIVVDPTGQFAGDIDTVRTQLTSSVDLVPMLVSFAYNGSRSWITGNLKGLYGPRYDMIPLLRSAQKPGRQYVVFATDELFNNQYNFDDAPFHIIGLITDNAKLGVYAEWLKGTTTIDTSSIQLEFYDYNTPGGLAELDNTPDDPRVKGMLQRLLNDIIPNELQVPLPSIYGAAQTVARAKYLVYETVVDSLGIEDTGLVVGL
jgi:arylsulfatase A-like enzyme